MFSCNVEDNLKRSEVGVGGSELVALGIMGLREGVRSGKPGILKSHLSHHSFLP